MKRQLCNIAVKISEAFIQNVKKSTVVIQLQIYFNWIISTTRFEIL